MASESNGGPYRAVQKHGAAHALCYCSACGVIVRLSLTGTYPVCLACKASAPGEAERPSDQAFLNFDAWIREAGVTP